MYNKLRFNKKNFCGIIKFLFISYICGLDSYIMYITISNDI